MQHCRHSSWAGTELRKQRWGASRKANGLQAAIAAARPPAAPAPRCKPQQNRCCVCWQEFPLKGSSAAGYGHYTMAPAAAHHLLDAKGSRCRQYPEAAGHWRLASARYPPVLVDTTNGGSIGTLPALESPGRHSQGRYRNSTPPRAMLSSFSKMVAPASRMPQCRYSLVIHCSQRRVKGGSGRGQGGGGRDGEGEIDKRSGGHGGGVSVRCPGQPAVIVRGRKGLACAGLGGRAMMTVMLAFRDKCAPSPKPRSTHAARQAAAAPAGPTWRMPLMCAAVPWARSKSTNMSCSRGRGGERARRVRGGAPRRGAGTEGGRCPVAWCGVQRLTGLH